MDLGSLAQLRGIAFWLADHPPVDTGKVCATRRVSTRHTSETSASQRRRSCSLGASGGSRETSLFGRRITKLSRRGARDSAQRTRAARIEGNGACSLQRRDDPCLRLWRWTGPGSPIVCFVTIQLTKDDLGLLENVAFLGETLSLDEGRFGLAGDHLNDIIIESADDVRGEYLRQSAQQTLFGSIHTKSVNEFLGGKLARVSKDR